VPGGRKEPGQDAGQGAVEDGQRGLSGPPRPGSIISLASAIGVTGVISLARVIPLAGQGRGQVGVPTVGDEAE
jgi:hypothetical protein